MARDIATINDGFAEDARENAGRAIRGTLLKYSKGVWTMGPGAEPVPAGFRAVAVESKTAWIKWQNGRPAEHIWRTPGKPLPAVDELPDRDQRLWPVDDDGEPQDPWQLTKYLFLVNPETAERYTFSPTSWGGRSEINELSEKIALMRTARPGALPIVELGTGTYTLTKRPQLGAIPKPVFKVVGWVSGHDGMPSAPTDYADYDYGYTTVEPPPLRELLDDDIRY